MTAGRLTTRVPLAPAPAILLLATALTVALAPARASAQCEGWRVGPFTTGSEGTNGTVWAITQWDPDGDGPLGLALVVGGGFTQIQGVSITNLAMRDPSTGNWVPVGPNGQAPHVNALAVLDGKLVVGTSGDNDVGTFDQTVKTWDGASWQSLGTTNTGSVRTMIVHDGSLYIGGSFWTTNTIPQTAPANTIARWDAGTGAWDNMDANTTNGQVLALASWNGELVVGGSFTLMGGNPHVGVARWDGANWLSMGLTAGSVNALQPFFGGLYVGGGGLNDGTTNMGGLGRWSGGGWSSAGGTFGGVVQDMTVFNGRLVIAGQFSGASANITQYDGGSYTGLGTGIGTSVFAMFPYGGVLWVGGSFTTAGGATATRLARWNGSGWSSVGGGTVAGVLAMTNFLGALVGGGAFSQTTYSIQPAVNIASWNGTSLSPFGSGMNGQVNALKSFKYPGINGNDELIAGGYFTVAGGVAANRIARWRVDPFVGFPPPAWEAMGAGMDGPVLAIERFNSATYAGGSFWASGGTALANIGRWNETTDVWENIVGSNGTVYALKAYGGYLYAGGSFTMIGGVSTGGLARYNGTSWSNVGGFFLGSVYALEVWNGLLVIGGDFTGINASPDLAWYNGSGYGTFATGGSNAAVTALHGNGSRLYVGGTFTAAGGVAANRIAYWDGTWHGMTGGGSDNAIYALGSLGGEEHAGGVFGAVGAGLWTPGWARYTTTGLPWFVQQPSNRSVSAGANVTLTARPAPGYAVQSLQWYRKGYPAVDGPTGTGSTISGSDQETLILENVSPLDAGQYRLVVTNACGTQSSNNATVTVDGVTAAPPLAEAGADAFEAIGPNPSSGAARATFALAADARVELRVHDVAGRRVRTLDAGALPAGRHQLSWDGRDDAGRAVRAGLYFVGLQAGGRSIGARRLLIQR